MANRKKPAPRPKPPAPAPELSIHPRRGRLIAGLVICLIVLAIVSEAIVAFFQSQEDLGTAILVAILYLVCLIYLLGLAWSSLRLLTDRQPSLQTNGEGLTLRHLPFVGNVNIPWSDVKSIHIARSLFLTHLCIVPSDAHQLLTRYGLLRFAINGTARFGMRTGTPLSISQSALEQPAKELVTKFEEDYGVKQTQR